MAIVNSPPNSPVDTSGFDKGAFRLIAVAQGWRNFFNAIYNVCNSLTESGPTASRPTNLLWIGRRYFDTTLGIPIWIQSAGPAVWVDATGAPV